MINIDYASLWGVEPGERDFSGAIQRLRDQDCCPKHLDNYVKLFKTYIN